MIISKDSYLRFPPKKLNTQQTTIFNALTYSVDICDLCYQRLYKQLIELSDKPESKDLIYPSVFSDAWSIINNSSIFLNLISRYFKKFGSSNLIEIKKAKKLRNSNQHIDERIAEIYVSKNFPIFGSLSWVKNFQDSNNFILVSLYAGVFTHHNEFETSINPGKASNEEIESIFLNSIIKDKNDFKEISVCLKAIMQELNQYVEMLENDFGQQIEKLEGNTNVQRHNSNMYIALKGRKI